LCVGFYGCWRIFLFIYLKFLSFLEKLSSLRLLAYMIFKAMIWCSNYILLFFRNIVFIKFLFYVFQHQWTLDLNSLSFISFIEQHFFIARIEDNLRYLTGPYSKHSYISSLNVLSLFFLLLFISNLDFIIIWTLDNWDKSELGIWVKI